ncbi:hypothetical protein GCM10009801_72630 [Streptomyces albiaxialis]|uniref:Uncharacterized protein n=1 Tax=Streptomyces albiaxialis TaxID=329523 RepID=A0ABN2WWR7_9ACTN
MRFRAVAVPSGSATARAVPPDSRRALAGRPPFRTVENTAPDAVPHEYDGTPTRVNADRSRHARSTEGVRRADTK